MVGADGTRSTCREAFLGQVDHPKPSGTLVYRISIDSATISRYPELVDLIDPPRLHVWLGPRSHVVCYGLKGVLSVVLSQPSDGKDEGIVLDVQKGDIDMLRTSFQSSEPCPRKLLEIAHEILRWPLLKSRQVKSWVHPSGRFTLVGDSAHSTFPVL